MLRTFLSLFYTGTLLLLAGGDAWAVATQAVTPEYRSATRLCDTLWTVNTRGLPACNPQAHTASMQFCVLDETCTWQPADLADFLATDDPKVTTVFWVHGNRHSSSEAMRQGLTIYRALTRCTTCKAPIRFVIFSWPSARTDAGPIVDLRIKADRTDAQSYYLAWLIDQMQGEVPVSLAGYSFGGRIATGAAHLLGGGILRGWTLEERVHPNRLPMQAALLAPALDNHWLIPGHRHGNALTQLTHLTVIYNSCDAALKRYRFLYCRTSGAQALGYTGIAGLWRMGTDATQIDQYDACPWVGRKHAWEHYFDCSPLLLRVREALLRSE